MALYCTSSPNNQTLLYSFPFAQVVCGQDVPTDWYSNPHAAWRHAMCWCWATGASGSHTHELVSKVPVSITTAILSGTLASSCCHLSLFFLLFFTGIIAQKRETTREQSPAYLMLSANTEIAPLFCHSSLLRGNYLASKGSEAAFGLMTWI